MDFTIKTYNELIDTLTEAGFQFLTYKDFINKEIKAGERVVILRHDVDARKEHSMNFAKIQNSRGICGTYYFRTIPQSYDERIIKEMSRMGHEIGYHYETMDTSNGNVDKAYDEFCRNLEMFRKIVEVKTICMHGSPLSKHDNRDIWKKYDYKKLGIIAEPYFDLDFNKTFYLTDTGRRWDGHKVSVRDKVMEGNGCDNPDFLKRRYHTTFDLISGLKDKDFPNRVMMTFHPQRWTDNNLQWMQELITQNLKNVVKRFMVK